MRGSLVLALGIVGCTTAQFRDAGVDGGVDAGVDAGSPGDAGQCGCTSGATETETEVCGNCGSQERSRVCSAGCWNAWSEWSACAGDVPVVDVTTHDLGGCAIVEGGSLYCWGGENEHGQIGVGDVRERLRPERVGADRWTDVVGGSLHVCGLQGLGDLYCWGANESGQLGIAVGDVEDRYVPTRVGDLSNWVQIGLGDHHSCARRGDGTLWCWGANWDGRLGLGDWTARETPTQVPGTDWAEVALGIHTCAIKGDETLWCWGYNANGQLGVGDEVGRLEPAQVLGSWRHVAAGQLHTCGIKTDGSLWCWGSNEFGQLGLGDNDERNTPQRVGSDTGWTQLALGESTSCALQDDQLYCWGASGTGNLGLGDFTSRVTPTRVGADTSWTFVAADWGQTCALASDGALWCWGYNTRVGLGDLLEHQVYPGRHECLAP